ncbi:hypothetical protein A3731_24940 [Roseovarius sp. HI0049]|nr:hypothetical protein A3731_24940 [Roseovarius sp. HI0049]
MTNIDHSQIVTVAMKQARLRTARQNAAKAECARRIEAVVDLATQMNLAAALSAHTADTQRGTAPSDATAISGLSDQDIATLLEMRRWITGMRQACARAADAPDEPPGADDHWPDPPAALAALAARF